MDYSDKIRSMVGEAIDELFEKVLSSGEARSESPIETVLSAAIVLHCMKDVAGGAVPLFMFTQHDSVEGVEEMAKTHYGSIVVGRQIQIGRYRADMLAVSAINFGRSDIFSSLIIECDGHEWHEKTKEQAASDKARDRFFTTSGYGVLRFAGSEIWEDATSCIDDIVQYFSMKRGFLSFMSTAAALFIQDNGKSWYDSGFDDGVKASERAAMLGGSHECTKQ